MIRLDPPPGVPDAITLAVGDATVVVDRADSASARVVVRCADRALTLHLSSLRGGPGGSTLHIDTEEEG